MLQLTRQIDRPGILFRLALDADAKRAFVGAASGKVYNLDLASDPVSAKEYEGHAGYVTGVVRCGEFLVSAAYDGKLIWRAIDGGQIIRQVDAHSRWIRHLVKSPDGSLIASVADDMVCRLWNSQTGELVRELAGHEKVTPNHFPSMLYCCVFTGDGTYLATGDRTGRAMIWNVASGEKTGEVHAPVLYTWDPKQRIHSIGGVRSAAFSPDGSLLALGGIGTIENIDHLDALARIEVFDWRSGERRLELAGKHKGLVECLSFDSQGKTLLAAGGDHGGFIEVFDTAEGKSLYDEKAPMHIHDYAWSENRLSLVAVGHGKIAIWKGA